MKLPVLLLQLDTSCRLLLSSRGKKIHATLTIKEHPQILMLVQKPHNINHSNALMPGKLYQDLFVFFHLHVAMDMQQPVHMGIELTFESFERVPSPAWP